MAEAAALFEGAMGVAPDSIETMSGARTNVNYHVVAGGASYAMRVPGEGTNGYIDRASEIANLERASGALPFVPRVLYADPSTGLLVSEFLAGARSLSLEDAADGDVLAGTASLLARLHGSGIEFENVFDLAETKKGYAALLESEGWSLPAEVVREAPPLEGALAECSRRCLSGLTPCHVDPNMANFMEREGEFFLIDWEYSGMCSPLFDLSNVVMTDRLDADTERRFLSCYEDAAGVSIDADEYLLVKVAEDYMWLFWHLIKLSQGQMVDYNEFSWRNRLNRALSNLKRIA